MQIPADLRSPKTKFRGEEMKIEDFVIKTLYLQMLLQNITEKPKMQFSSIRIPLNAKNVVQDMARTQGIRVTSEGIEFIISKEEDFDVVVNQVNILSEKILNYHRKTRPGTAKKALKKIMKDLKA